MVLKGCKMGCFAVIFADPTNFFPSFDLVVDLIHHHFEAMLPPCLSTRPDSVITPTYTLNNIE
jgi:hypothetical protein